MSAEQRRQVEGRQSNDILGAKERTDPTQRFRGPIVDALLHTESPFSDSFGVFPYPIINNMEVRILSYLIGLDRSYPLRIGPNREVHMYALNSGIGSVSATFSASKDQGGQALFDYFFVTPKELGDAYHSELLTAIGERNVNEPVIVAATYGSEGGVMRSIKHEVLEERTNDNGHHFDNLEKLLEELNARKEAREAEED